MKIRRLKHSRIGRNRPETVRLYAVDLTRPSRFPRLRWDAELSCAVLETGYLPKPWQPKTFRLHCYSAEPVAPQTTQPRVEALDEARVK